MKLLQKVFIAGAIGVAVTVVANYCLKRWRTDSDGDKEKKEETSTENDAGEISMIPASGILKEEVEEIPLNSGTLTEAVKEIPMAQETREECTRFENSKKTKQVDEPSQDEPKRETFLFATVFNRKLINVLIDTGANECLIRKDLVTDISKIIPLGLPNTRAKLFDGSQVDVLGFVIEKFTHKDKTVVVPFYVVAELSNNGMILGSYWIRESGTILAQQICYGIYRFEVDGIGPIDVLIDSGTEVCLVRKDVLTDSIKSKMQPLTDKTFILPDGSKMDNLGYVILSVSYLGKTAELPFYVADESCILPMILGTTWIRKSGAILQSDGTRLAVTFGGKEENKCCRVRPCSLPYVSVELDGIGMRAMVDTGSQMSSIGRSILTDLQKSREVPTFSSTFVGNGTIIKRLGIVSLNITFQGKETCIEVAEMDAGWNDNQLVLGMDWMDQTKAVIQSDGSELIVSLSESPPKTKKKVNDMCPDCRKNAIIP